MQMPDELIAGRYELVREIGRGASATVFRAHDRLLDRDIAIKLVAPALANDPSFVDRFMREARLSASLNHPNIVSVHDVGETSDHRPFLAMQLVEGASLDEVIKANAPLPLAEASRILAELGTALDYLHAQGLIHRDVKPSNVLIEESGRLLLSDFGIAYARESARYTMTGMLLGTPRYMAPEQMLGGEPTPQTDVYAMGVLAFEMLAGTPPFDGTGTALMYKIVHELPPPLRSHAPSIPEGIEAVIDRALRKDPAERWATPGEFAAAFASPDANATLASPARAFGAAAAVPAVGVSAAALAERPEPEPMLPAPPDTASSVNGTGRRGGGRKRALLGAGGAGAIGVLLAGYCLAAGGDIRNSSNDDETPTATASTSPATVPGASSQAPAATATASTAAPGTAATSSPAATVAGTLPAPVNTNSPPPATSTLTPTPQPTSTNTPQPTSTTTPPPTATTTPTATNTPPSPVTVTPTTSPPNAPSNVTISQSGTTLSWSDNSNNENGFRLYWRSTTIGSEVTSVTQSGQSGPNSTSASVPLVNISANQYDFRRGVSAYNAAGESAIAWSN